MIIFGGMSLEDDLSDVWILSPELEVVDFSAVSGPQIQYELETRIPQEMKTIEPKEPSKVVDMSQLEGMKADIIEKIGGIFDVLSAQLQDLTIMKRTLEADRAAFEAERDEHYKLYDKQQKELKDMLESHRAETEQWITKQRLEIDAQRRGNEEVRLHLDNEATELQGAKELFTEKSRKLDAIMKQVQGLAD
jgi:hypothetical protein